MEKNRPVVVVNSIIFCGDEILLIKRNKKPFIGKWCFVGGKLEVGESIKDCALRETKEETGLDCVFEKINLVSNEQLKGDFEKSFLFVLCTLRTDSKDFLACDEGELNWFDKNNLPEGELSTPDLHHFKNYSNSQIKIHELEFTEINNEITSFKVND